MVITLETSYILIDKDMAKIGERFYFKIAPECLKCKFKNICLKNKKEGLLYEIIEVKKPLEKVICKITNSEAYLAKVKPADVRIAIPTSDLIINTPIYYSPLKCGEVNCPYITYCNFRLPEGKDKILIRVIKKITDLDCPLGKRLSLVEAEIL